MTDLTHSNPDHVDNIPRHKSENPFNYTKMQLAHRSKAIKDAEKDYPGIPPTWIEMMYDVVENKSKEEIEEIINSGAWETPAKVRDIPETLMSGEILDFEGKLLESEGKLLESEESEEPEEPK